MWWLIFLTALALSAGGNQPAQYGPDPWHTVPMEAPDPDSLVPPDLRRVERTADGSTPSVADGFFRRLLVIVLKNGALQTHDDGSKEISMVMKLPYSHWSTLEEYIHSEKPLTEDMYRRIVGYLADAVYKPSFKEKVVQAWSEYVMVYYNWYKAEITWITTAVAIVATLAMMSKYMSRSVFIIIMLVILYLYEGFISFKEFEKKDYDKFVSAVSRCKWYFWSSSCDMPMSDPLVFWKHMHPGKIGIRVLALLVTEPLVLVSSSITEISNNITGGLWYPFNLIAHSGLIIILNMMCIVLIVMVVCNFFLNIHFNISFLAGLLSFGVVGRNTTQTPQSVASPAAQASNASNNTDSLSGENLQTVLAMIANGVSFRSKSKKPATLQLEGRIHRRSRNKKNVN